MFNKNRSKSSGGGYKGGGKKYGGRSGGTWNKGGFGGGRGGDRPEMHRATCAKCNSECEVPFRPNGSKPIFCSNCFKRDGDTPSYGEKRHNYSHPAADRGGDRSNQSVALQLKEINDKLDALIEALMGEEDEDEIDEDEDVEEVKK